MAMATAYGEQLDEVKLAKGTCSKPTRALSGSSPTARSATAPTTSSSENLLTHLWLKTNGYAAGDDVLVGTGGENDWFLV